MKETKASSEVDKMLVNTKRTVFINIFIVLLKSCNSVRFSIF